MPNTTNSHGTSGEWRCQLSAELGVYLSDAGAAQSSERIRNLVLNGDVYVLQLGIAFHGVHAEVSAKAALFEAAERGFDMHARMGVDAHHSAFNGPCHANRPLQV